MTSITVPVPAGTTSITLTFTAEQLPFNLETLRFSVSDPIIENVTSKCPSDAGLSNDDGPVCIVDSFVGFQGSRQSRRFSASNRDVLFSVLPGQTVLPKGPPGSFDETGAWIMSAEKVGSLLKVWYHAECHSNYNCGHTYKSLAYAESTNNGLSFTKMGQFATINNEQACPPGCGPTCNQYGIGDGQVFQFHGYYFCYAGTTDNSGIGVLSTPVSSGGGPGTWWRWDATKWTTAINSHGSPMVDTDGNRIPNVTPAVYTPGNVVLVFGPQNGKLWVWASKDGISGWVKKSTPIMDAPQDWNPVYPRLHDHYWNFSVYPLAFTGQFDLYYSHNPQGGLVCQSQRERRTITVTQE